MSNFSTDAGEPGDAVLAHGTIARVDQSGMGKDTSASGYNEPAMYGTNRTFAAAKNRTAASATTTATPRMVIASCKPSARPEDGKNISNQQPPPHWPARSTKQTNKRNAPKLPIAVTDSYYAAKR